MKTLPSSPESPEPGLSRGAIQAYASTAPTPLIVIEIGRDTYVLPKGRKVEDVFAALNGLRAVKTDYFYRVFSDHKSIEVACIDDAVPEMAVRCVNRVVVTKSDFHALQEAERAAQREAARREEDAKGGAK